MSLSFTEILKELKTDSSFVLNLYEKLYTESFFALVLHGTESDLQKTEFLSYETIDKVFELPLFTSENIIFENLPKDTLVLKVCGKLFWERLIEIMENPNLQIAIDPGQFYGIRLRKEMILGMLSKYGS